LFIVPWLAAGTRPGRAFDSALNSTSTIRCEVSTFPPATEAGGFALTTVPNGATTSIGSVSPALAGTSSAPTRQRKT
jgi:hypothetical protein